MAQTYDTIVIGTGQAGPTLAADLAGAGKRVAIVERHRFGGTCVNVGCIPTKALVASARAAHVARRAADYGVVIDSEVRVDMARVRARKDDIVRRSNEGWNAGSKASTTARCWKAMGVSRRLTRSGWETSCWRRRRSS